MKKSLLIFALLLTVIITSCSDISGMSEIRETSSKIAVSAAEKTESSYETAEAVDTSELTEALTETSSQESETVSAVSETTAETEAVIGDYQTVGENGILVINRNNHYMGLMPCWGTYDFCDSYINSVNSYAKLMPDVQIYSMIIPTSVEFYLPDSLSGFSASQKDKIDYINNKLIDVISVDAYSALSSHIGEEIFSRTDHHWLPLGAFYAGKEFAKAANFNYDGLDKYKTASKDGYVGSLYSYSKDINLYNDPELYTIYIPEKELVTTYFDTSFNNPNKGDLFITRDASAYYCSFLGSDQLIAKIETGANTNRTLVVFKESYGNAVIPFITGGFDTIYVCDIRYFDLNAIEFCKKAGATDLLFAACTFTPAGVNSKYFDLIKNN